MNEQIYEYVMIFCKIIELLERGNHENTSIVII
ncbi:MAG: hypothetical protein DDT40_01826 [candidate division WS2 bacterium]|nr:hypothetical protein [Candidatus Psychracetigena formicireducens]